jgi:pyruvate dehydrogenase E2 component (dihydrolipoamide acetyltransferase)
MTIFYLPDLGEGLTEAQLHAWHVKVGEKVQRDAPLATVETAKALVDIPSPQTGVITECHGQAGDTLEVGQPLITFQDNTTPSYLNHPPEQPKETPEAPQKSPYKQAKTAAKRIKATPGVKALAKKLAVNLADITATGHQGQITRADVEHASGPPAHCQVKPLSAIERNMAKTMTQAWQQVVPVTLTEDVSIQAWQPQQDPSWRIIRALVQACEQHPSLNAHFDGQSMQRTLFSTVNIGMAMDSQHGLLVPVIKHAETLTAQTVREQIDHYKKAVQERAIAPEDLQGSTIQLSNFGSLAGRYASPIIVPPIVAILGTGKIRQEIRPEKNQPACHHILPLSLTVDHRVITGGEAARFLKTLMEDLERAS